MDEPEIVKMLKYILLISGLAICVSANPLVTGNSVSVVAIQADILPSLTDTESYGKILAKSLELVPIPVSNGNNGSRSGGKVEMSPVLNISDIQEELTSNSSGGQKHVRQVLESSPTGSPPPSDELCSIFQFFLEPRRYSKCRVSNSFSEINRGNARSESAQTSVELNSNLHRPVSNEVSPGDGRSGVDTFSSQSENREVESIPVHITRRDGNEPSASKRYDHLDDFDDDGPPPPPPPGSEEDQNPPPPHHHHHHHQHHPHSPSHHHHHPLGPPPQPPQPGPPQMPYPKSSLDRTTIIVPERPCPRGERRDHKGFCRRVVRVRPSYQYGPPPPPYGPPRPVRYYYSRFVSVPTLQFFVPAVP